MGFGEKRGGFPINLGEEHKASTEGGTSDDPRHRRFLDKKFKTSDEFAAPGLSPEEEAAEDEERAQTPPDYSGTDSARLDIAELQSEDERRREDLRLAEHRAGWSPRKGATEHIAPDELHSDTVKKMAEERARLLREKSDNDFNARIKRSSRGTKPEKTPRYKTGNKKAA